MGQSVSRTDFEWVYTDEPHKTRRKQILEKYPEVKKLMGHDIMLKYIVNLMILAQIIAAYLVQDISWPLIIVVAYCFGGVINHSLTLAIHEISHNLAFGNSKPLQNRLLAIWANLPIVLPYSVSFKKYHMEHHRYQGDDELDMDVPSRLEAKLFTNTFTKLLWIIFQPFFYAIRPVFMRPKALTAFDYLNIIVQVIFDSIILKTMGYKSLVYLLLGNWLGMGLHPVAGHFISEHYMFIKGYETYSYYGPLNWITFNVGYHNEHHDFPNIPGSRLPKLKSIASEFYKDLPCHTSWTRVLYDFITDPAIGPYARVKRKQIPNHSE